MKKLMLTSLIFTLLISLCACGSSKTEQDPLASQSTASAESSQGTSFSDGDTYAGTYTGFGLYVDGHYLTDASFSSMTTTLEADGTGSLDWGEDNEGPISEWTVTKDELLIKAGTSEIEGSISEGMMLLDLGDGYIVAFVAEGYDTDGLSTASLEDYMI